MTSQIITKKRIIIGVSALIVISVFFYFYPSNKEGEGVSELTPIEQIDNQQSAINTNSNSAKVVRLILELEQAQFPKDTLTSPLFSSLVDNTVELTSEEPGRVNPFAEIGVGGRPGVTEEQPQIQTSSTTPSSQQQTIKIQNSAVSS